MHNCVCFVFIQTSTVRAYGPNNVDHKIKQNKMKKQTKTKIVDAMKFSSIIFWTADGVVRHRQLPLISPLVRRIVCLCSLHLILLKAMVLHCIACENGNWMKQCWHSNAANFNAEHILQFRVCVCVFFLHFLYPQSPLVVRMDKETLTNCLCFSLPFYQCVKWSSVCH